VWAVSFAGESQVIGGNTNGDIRRWQIEDGQQRGPAMQGSGHIESVVVSQDGQWIVSGDRGWKTIVWNAATHEKVREFAENPYWVHGVDISGDGTKIASTSTNTVLIFSRTSDTRPLPLLPHDGVTAVKFSPDGIAPLAWSPDGQTLFVASKGKIIYFDISKFSSSEWSIHENQSAVHIASNGRFIACAAGLSVSLWDCVSHKQISSIITHAAEVKCVALSPSGGYLACGNG
ncbi:hypothetical protein M404DRAFT_105341, partial [Pisolithus tinctorius Marx 270]